MIILQRLTTAPVSRLTGMSVRMLNSRLCTKLALPLWQEQHGKRSRRLYTFQDIVAVLTQCKLQEWSSPLQKILAIISNLKVIYFSWILSGRLSQLTLITDEKDV